MGQAHLAIESALGPRSRRESHRGGRRLRGWL